MTKLEKYQIKHFPSFFVNLILDFSAIKNAGVFKLKFIKSLLKKSKVQKYTIFNGKEIVGGLDIVNLGNKKYNIGIIVFRKYRNQGIAKEATKNALEIIRKLGGKNLCESTLKKNKGANKVLLDLKFKEIKETEKEIFWEKSL
jgi:RimJ/RimL family protein N-acetyltransferase